MGLTFRKAEPGDEGLILHFIRELAEYEHMQDEVVTDEGTLREWVFGKKGCEVLFPSVDGREIGYALFFSNFSTFLGRSGMYLEDLYITPAQRGRGYGKATLAELARICTERGYGRLEWWCLDWNKPSIDFYLGLGAEPMSEWTTYRLTGDTLAALAESARDVV
jgi:GNAT superfamily N-acetyltransferase